eukprot:TRINITY_DN463_c1_g4_i4.p2 TRINITY_DN463_c1_g4~~TRINITY_DN463_c1_g4_i4.p2  ORF type:complete len:238 (-),score=18.20 TRINITY_DN463_c1_g4_i4:3314-4027(-)
MFQDTDFKFVPAQDKDGKLSIPDSNKPCHLRLVVSNPAPVQEKRLPQTADSKTGFTADIRKKEHPPYALIARDSFHRLECEIVLKIHDREDDEEREPRTVACHFPHIAGEELNELVEEDETLYGMIMIQFQLKILEQILLFSSGQDALTLLICTDHESECHALEVYRTLVVHEGKIPTQTGTQTRMAIPTTPKNFDKLINLMDHINQDFRQMLWEDQRDNTAIREYLKSNPCLTYFG